MFSLEVETYLRERGHDESAEFVHLVQCWHAACDQCGACADYRVASLYEMYTFLAKDCDFDHFPSQFCHGHYKGMPIHTFEALSPKHHNLHTTLLICCQSYLQPKIYFYTY